MKAILATALWSLSTTSVSDARPDINHLADSYVQLRLEADATAAYRTGLPFTRHDKWPDRSSEGRRNAERREDQIWVSLNRIAPETLGRVPQQRAYATLKEQLGAERGIRVCEFPLWRLDHLFGWQLSLGYVAAEQPVGTPALREQALRRWNGLPDFIDTEIANLEAGLAKGYSTPKPIVAKVIKQVEALTGMDPEKSPLYSPVLRSEDSAFKTSYRALLVDKVNPSLRRYADYLRMHYLPRARETLAITAHPNGSACYKASLRLYTTLDTSPDDIHALGLRTVAGNREEVRRIGRRLYGTDDIPTIVSRVNAVPDNHFRSEEEMVDYVRSRIALAENVSRNLVSVLPTQRMEIRALEAYQAGTGSSGSYRPSADPEKPGIYIIPAADNWKTETKGSAAIAAVHEGWPGHHLQYAISNSGGQSPLDKLIFNSGYVEGWGRYAEILGEELGIIENPYSVIIRRLWFARNAVVDTGLHAKSWSRQQAVDFMLEAGRFSPQFSDDLVDRMAIWPGQTAAYDIGALELIAQRDRAKNELKDRFNLREFHDVVLTSGVVPLIMLRDQVAGWINSKRRIAAPQSTGCAQSGFHEWDFWLGRWRVTDGSGAFEGIVENVPASDGCSFIETMTDKAGRRGVSVNVYDPARKSWSQLWAAPGTIVRLEGRPKGEANMRAEGTITYTAPGIERPFRIVWTVAADGSVTQNFFEKRSESTEWKASFTRIYRREM